MTSLGTPPSAEPIVQLCVCTIVGLFLSAVLFTSSSFQDGLAVFQSTIELESSKVERFFSLSVGPVVLTTGSRVPAGHAEESHPRRQDAREDEAGQAGGGRQPDAAGQEGQDQEQPAATGRAGQGGPSEPLPGPHQ